MDRDGWGEDGEERKREVRWMGMGVGRGCEGKNDV